MSHKNLICGEVPNATLEGKLYLCNDRDVITTESSDEYYYPSDESYKCRFAKMVTNPKSQYYGCVTCTLARIYKKS